MGGPKKKEQRRVKKKMLAKNEPDKQISSRYF